MQKSLAELQPQLKEMSEKATKMTKQIEQETITVEKASAVVKEDEKVANKQAAAAQNLKRECEADLAEAIPILEEVRDSLFLFYKLSTRWHIVPSAFFYNLEDCI